MGAEEQLNKEMADTVAPWELRDLEQRMNKLLAPEPAGAEAIESLQEESARVSSSPANEGLGDVMNQVDQFLRDALQNPRERLTSECLFLFAPFTFRVFNFFF